MKLRRITFIGDAPSPLASMERGNWLPGFSAADGYDIELNGDVVTVRHPNAPRPFVYPWARIAGAELDLPDPQTGKMTAPAIAASTDKRGKR
jgi:hypothetical protein